jgi:hypothetical protein
MRFSEFITEGWDDSPYTPTTLRTSEYRGLSNPLGGDQPYGSDHKDATQLWDAVEDLIESGAEPHVMPVQLISLHATQDWLSSEASDEALFPGYEDHPVVLKQHGVNYILDGHNRVAAAQRKRAGSIVVYLFGLT